jgi:hypothetical protein
MDGLGMTYTATAVNDLRQQTFENQQKYLANQSNLKSAALQQESTGLDLQAKKIDLQNQEDFKKSVLAKMSEGQQSQSDLAKLSGAPTPHDQMKQKLEDVNGKIQSHVSLVQATQKAIDEYATKDPAYAAKMQTQLNEQIAEGFKLTKEQNAIKAGEASKVSDGMAPIFGTDGKMDPEMYKAWYARNQADGVPLAQMGLTGDPALDDKTARLIYAQGVKAKDQVTMQAKMHSEKEKGFMDESLRKSRDSNMYHQRWLEANAHNNGPKGATTNDAKLVKEQNGIYNKYITDYGKLKANYDKAKAGGDSTTADAVKHEIDVLNSNFEQQKRGTSTAFGKQPTVAPPKAPPKKEAGSTSGAPKNATQFFVKNNIPHQ